MKSKECQARYLIKALLLLARPGAVIKDDFQYCVKEKCAWYSKRGCLLVERR